MSKKAIRHNFVISVTSDEMRELQRRADFHGLLITEYIKEKALSEAYRPQVRYAQPVGR